MSKPIPYLEMKAGLLLFMLVALVASAVTYLMYARGAFELSQQLVLITDDSEGVNVGMDLTFSGFAIGRVRRIDLDNEGKVRISVDLAKKDAKWVRQNSIFTIERGLVGGTHLKAFTGDLTAPLIKDGAVRPVLRGDATSEIPRLMSSVRTLVENMEKMTQAESPLNTSLGNVQSLTGRMGGRYGLLGSVLGDEAHAKKLVAAIDGVNQLLVRSDTMLNHADAQLFGPQGVRADAQATVQQLNGLLADARVSLKKVDGVLAEAEKIAGNARVATDDLGQLRAQVDLSLRKVEHLVNEVNRKWPLARDTELKLP